MQQRRARLEPLYAERGSMFYYAYVNENKICTGVYALPSSITGDSYIVITEAEYTSQSVVGMKYENGVWVEVTTYYYAILNDKGIVEYVHESETEMGAADNLVEITAEQYADETLVGKYYDRENNVFIVPPISVLKEHSTNEIQYKDNEKWLSDKLDELDAAIANCGTAVDAYTKDESDAKYAAVGTSYTKAESDAKYALAGATGATMTAAEILTAIKDVDGAGSGLDADTLDGKQAAEFALATDLDGKADATHSHSEYAATEHTHTGYASTDHAHSGYAASDHTHSGYASTDHAHSGYAATSHSHAQSDISGLASALAAKADSSHTHSGYAASNHTHSNYAASTHSHSGYANASHSHSEYFEKTGGTISGETNFSGGLVRVKGVQTLYHSGSQMVLSSENLPTKICGSAITSSKSITVASDERLKADIHELDKQALIDFAKQVQIVAYRYLGEEDIETPHVGVIAQQLLEINPQIAKYFVKENKDGFYSVDYTALSLLGLLTLQ